jgi:DNA repair protein RadC
MVMKCLAPRDRPREKLARVGSSSLGDNELLAIVLGEGSREQNALELANQVLDDVGGLGGLARAAGDQLQRRRGVGTTKAARIIAAIELGRRTLAEWAHVERPQMASPREAAAYLVPLYGSRRVEQCGIVLLDTRYRLLQTVLLSVGVLDRTCTHPREVFREAVAGGASAIVMFHNHPSGDPTPSGDDLQMTRRIFEAGELMGVMLIDHLVLAENKYFSFRENCMPGMPAAFNGRAFGINSYGEKPVASKGYGKKGDGGDGGGNASGGANTAGGPPAITNGHGGVNGNGVGRGPGVRMFAMKTAPAAIDPQLR